MDSLQICPNCGRPVQGTSVCSACGFAVGQSSLRGNYPKTYGIQAKQTKTLAWFFVVVGIAGAIWLTISFYRLGATPETIMLSLSIELSLAALCVWMSLREGNGKVNSVTLYEDHVEWIGDGRPGSCSNQELTITFGNVPQFLGSPHRAGKDIRIGPAGGPYMWATTDFEDFGELVSDLQRRRRQ